MRLSEFEYKIKELLGEGFYSLEIDSDEDVCTCEGDNSIIIRTKIYMTDSGELVVGDVFGDPDDAEDRVIGKTEEEAVPLEEGPKFQFR